MGSRLAILSKSAKSLIIPLLKLKQLFDIEWAIYTISFCQDEIKIGRMEVRDYYKLKQNLKRQNFGGGDLRIQEDTIIILLNNLSFTIV